MTMPRLRWHGDRRASCDRREKTRDSRGIYFPNYIEPVSHIAVDVRTTIPAALPPALTPLLLSRADWRLSSKSNLLHTIDKSSIVSIPNRNPRIDPKQRLYPALVFTTERKPYILAPAQNQRSQ